MKVEGEHRHLPPIYLAGGQQRAAFNGNQWFRPIRLDGFECQHVYVVEVHERHARVIAGYNRICGLVAFRRDGEKRRAARRVDDEQIAVRQRVRQIAVEDVQVIINGWQGTVQIAAKGFDSRQAAERLFQEQVAGGQHQDTPRPRAAGDCPRRVVLGQIVRHGGAGGKRQAGLQGGEIGRQRLSRQCPAFARRNGAALRVEQVAVYPQIKNHFGILIAKVGDLREKLGSLARQRAGCQRRDRHIIAGAPHRHEAHIAADGRQPRQVAQVAVADDDHVEIVGIPAFTRRQRQRRHPICRRMAGLHAVDSIAQDNGVVGGGGQHLRHFGDANHGHDVVCAERVHDVQRLSPGFVQTARAVHVRCVHAGGGVQQQDYLPRADGRDDHVGTRQRQHQEQQDQQLQEQKQIAPKSLPGGIGLIVLENLLPQIGAGHQYLAAAQAQHVEQDDGYRQQRAEKGKGS